MSSLTIVMLTRSAIIELREIEWTGAPLRVSQRFGVDAVVGLADLKLPLEKFSKRFLVPMMTLLARQIPPGAKMLHLRLPAETECALESYDGIVLRGIRVAGNLRFDLMLAGTDD